MVANDHAQEVSLAGFMRFVGTNLKSAQNKGVIEWYTPKEYVELCRQAMGSIDLDPASCAKANRIVKAEIADDEPEIEEVSTDGTR